MKVLFLGEIVGRCGIGVIKNTVSKLKEEEGVDLVIANAEGATGGYGLGFGNAQSLNHMGIDVITLGEKAFYKLDLVENIGKRDKILRPANFPEDVPGRGVRHYSIKDKRVCVINMLGMMGFKNPHLNNPFLYIESIAQKAIAETPYVFVVFHAQATAEKVAMGRLLDGKVSAVVGTHSKALTSDATIMKNGTAYITDLGLCGSSMSVGGFDPENEIKKLRTSLPFKSRETWKHPQLQGLMAEFDEQGKATGIQIIRRDVEVQPLQQTY